MKFSFGHGVEGNRKGMAGECGPHDTFARENGFFDHIEGARCSNKPGVVAFPSSGDLDDEPTVIFRKGQFPSVLD
jgi:hypothetical protein